MVKNLITFFAALALAAPCALAQDESASSDESSLAPQSEIVSVLNEKDADGNYIVGRSDDGFPTVTFRFTVPEEATTFSMFGMESDYTKNVVGGYYLMYYPAAYVKNLQYAFVKTRVSTADGGFDNSLWNCGSVTCTAGTDDAGRTIHDFTLVINKVSDRNYSYNVALGNFNVALPKVAVTLRDANKVRSLYAEYAAATYSFVSDGKENVKQLSGAVASSSLTDVESTSLLFLKPGAVLTVDNDFVCKNIFVSAADEESDKYAPAGIVINDGAQLTADSIFFLANDEYELSVPFLINRGTLAAGVSFLKNAHNQRDLMMTYANTYGYYLTNSTTVTNRYRYALPSFASPVKNHDGMIDAEFRQHDEDNKIFYSALWSPFTEPVASSDGKETTKYFGLSCVVDWQNYYSTDDCVPFYVSHLYSGSSDADNCLSVRVTGEVNDEESYDLKMAVQSITGYESGAALRSSYLRNPYPAVIDWRGLAEGNDELVKAVRDIQTYNYSAAMYSVYNLKTGLTTFDAPRAMFRGYLQPAMSAVEMMHFDGSLSEISVGKGNVTSLQEAAQTYAADEAAYPYVRLYVDDPESSLAKGEGRRSVLVLYFVPQETYDELHSPSCGDYDESYDLNLLYESLADTRLYDVEAFRGQGGGEVFPYIGALSPNAKETGVKAAIKMVPIPEKSEADAAGTKQYEETLSGLIKIAVDPYFNKRTDGAVTLGVLDYDLKDSKVGLKIGDISLNYPEVADCLSSTISYTDGYKVSDTDTRSFSSGRFGEWSARLLGLDLNVSVPAKDPTSIDDAAAAVSIAAAPGAVTVSTSVAGSLRVFDLAGRLVCERGVAAGTTAVGVPQGAYVASFTSAQKTAVRRVIVK